MSIDTYSFYRNRSSLQFCVFNFQGFVLLLKFLSGISKILWKQQILHRLRCRLTLYTKRRVHRRTYIYLSLLLWDLALSLNKNTQKNLSMDGKKISFSAKIISPLTNEWDNTKWTRTNLCQLTSSSCLSSFSFSFCNEIIGSNNLKSKLIRKKIHTFLYRHSAYFK